MSFRWPVLLLLGIAVACGAQDPRSTPRIGKIPVDRFPEFLRTLGYQPTVTDKAGILLDIRDGEWRFEARLYTQALPDDARGFVGNISLTAGFRTGRYLPKEALEEWKAKMGLGSENINSYLDGTVFVQSFLTIAGNTEEDVQRSIVRLEKSLGLLRKGPLAGAQLQFASVEKAYDDAGVVGSTRVHGLERRDIDYLARQWHYSPKPGMRVVTLLRPGFSPTVVGASGGTLYVDAPNRLAGQTPATYIVLAVVVLKATEDAFKGITWANVSKLGRTGRRIEKILDLKDGVTLDQLRAQIEDFGAKVASLHLDASGTGAN